MVIGTHEHWDYVDGMVQIRRDSKDKFALHKQGVDALAKGNSYVTAAQPVYNKQISPIETDEVLQDGQVLKIGDTTIQIIHTPGHTPGSICAITESAGIHILFAGYSIGGWFDLKSSSSRSLWIKSLKKLLSYDFDIMLTGHSRGIIYADAKQRTKEQLQCLETGFLAWAAPYYQNFVYKFLSIINDL